MEPSTCDTHCDIPEQPAINEDIAAAKHIDTVEPEHKDTTEHNDMEDDIEATDARPDPEVDAKPIVKPPSGSAREPVWVATEKESDRYILEEAGVKKVIIFNQKKFASRLQLGTQCHRCIDAISISSLPPPRHLHNIGKVSVFKPMPMQCQTHDIRQRYMTCETLNTSLNVSNLRNIAYRIQKMSQSC